MTAEKSAGSSKRNQPGVVGLQQSYCQDLWIKIV